MAKFHANEVAGECASCKVVVEAHEGARRYSYTDSVIECLDCAQVRLANEERVREERTREGQVLFALLPSLAKLGELYAIQMGDTFGTTHSDVGYRGDTYRVTVQRVNEE